MDKNIPAHEKTVNRLGGEAWSVVFAGSETTANVLTTIHFHLLANPSKMDRLKEELEGAMPDPNMRPTLQTLEQLPFLVSNLDIWLMCKA